MTNPANSISEELVEKAGVAYLLSPHMTTGESIDKKALRSALEAVWPEPLFTRDEAAVVIDACISAPQLLAAKDPRRGKLRHARAKLEAMRDGTL